MLRLVGEKDEKYPVVLAVLERKKNRFLQVKMVCGIVLHLISVYETELNESY